ncbi:MAG: DUF1553 domain-containing protein, partial [Verrucomicrobiota bacterium]
GGPSVYPPQPDGVYAFTQRGKTWNTEKGPNRFRRAMYTQFFRSAPYPLFTTFDAPDFSSVCTQRVKSNTPLQALNLANDPVFLEFAQALALRLAKDSPGYEDGILKGYELCYSRPPSEMERTALLDFARVTYRSYQENQSDAQALSNDAIIQAAGGPAEAATMVNLARVLLNTDNFITRE